MKKKVVFITVLICLISGEILARVSNFMSNPKLRPLHGDTLDKSEDTHQLSMYTHHAVKPFWKGRRSISEQDKQDGITDVFLEYNSLGIRGQEINAKNSNYRVLLLRDSFIAASELAYEDTVGTRLRRRLLNDKIEIIQHGVTSWSPITEFAWFSRFAQDIEIEKVYLFINDTDFFSFCAYGKGDDWYRKKYVFGRKGEPLFMPYLKPHILLDNSYLLSYLRLNVIASIRPKLRQVFRLFREDIPLYEKKSRLMRRIFKDEEIYPPECPGCFDEVSEFFKKHVVEEKFVWNNRLFVETVMLRLSSSEWDGVLWQGVNAAMTSITDFSQYLFSRGIELVVVYIPTGFDIDRYEHNIDSSFQDGYAFVPCDIQGIEKYIEMQLDKLNVSFLNLKPYLREYKQRSCPECENFLYFKHNGHWNSNAHRIVSEVLEKHLKGGLGN